MAARDKGPVFGNHGAATWRLYKQAQTHYDMVSSKT